MLAPIVGGLLAGAGHALSGPDHLAAVLPIALGRGRSAALAGFSWGLGHGVGLMAVGAAFLFAREALGIEVLSGHAESLVGAVLMFTGILAISRAARHAPPPGGEKGHVAAAGIGVIHGAAGMAHVLVLVAALAFPTPVAAAWLLAFTVGAATAVGLAALLTQRVFSRAEPALARRIRMGGGAVTLLVGAVWLGLSLTA